MDKVLMTFYKYPIVTINQLLRSLSHLFSNVGSKNNKYFRYITKINCKFNALKILFLDRGCVFKCYESKFKQVDRCPLQGYALSPNLRFDW